MREENPSITRKEFLRTWARRLSVVILAGGGGVLASRKPEEAIDHTCIHRGICAGCPSFEGCRLPQAISAKAYKR